MSKTREILKKLASEHMDVNITEEYIESGGEFKDLGLDSLDSIELIVKVEDHLDIELDDERLEGVSNIKELLEYLSEFD